jgi:hypothetical protein
VLLFARRIGEKNIYTWLIFAKENSGRINLKLK